VRERLLRTVMYTCNVCGRSIEGPRLTDEETGAELHPGCLGGRLADQAPTVTAGFLALLLAPPIHI
jgi:hypothetical protein